MIIYNKFNCEGKREYLFYKRVSGRWELIKTVFENGSGVKTRYSALRKRDIDESMK